MKYITILEVGNTDSPNVGTISDTNTENAFKEAIEAHFDATMTDYKVADNLKLTDCISACPIDVTVTLDVPGEVIEQLIELSETWFYS